MKESNTPSSSRRTFLRQLSGTVGGTLLSFSLPAWAVSRSPQGWEETGDAAPVQDTGRKLGIALVGLGNYSTHQLAPALEQTKNCRLAGIVTGTPAKAEKWKRKYNIPNRSVYNYQNFDAIKDNPDIDIVYVVLPNSMHAEFTIRAAAAGKHVICEKPMAISVKECEQMIEACQKADRLLSIGYRLHFEPHNLTMMEFGKNNVYGAVKKVQARDGMDIEPNVWRLDKKLAGGGPLMDVGIYCVQAAIYTVGKNPIAVTAREGEKTDLKRFSQVEQSLLWQLEFPGGVLADCETSYAKEMNMLRVDAERGWYALEPAYAYKGITGSSSQGKLDLPQVNQQALQMDDFATCVRQNKKSRVPGEMGLRDVRILTAIYEAASTGVRIELNNL
ncbi:Gfo/Idh/MocA family oxidoreductase [Fulvivirgaceae bacterium PWU5]|uniref:Gfo/Idh/MocA family oxidoreductase n=1 Tax=Dawidia cretensis TaxID=2782350 RepID=A0AAP2E432_9BACT|nr:Gfo/Idh/MocA family oxidoreductase [Dawidia cretensis]MBT1711259.1 Gfo/Idh/MocA family oxidoreductase [Dawidia cretensis]